MTPKEVLEFAKKNDAKQLDLRFTDIPSLQHHVSYPSASWTRAASWTALEWMDRASAAGRRSTKAICC